MSDVRTFTVSEEDDGIRLDRWFKRHLPDVSFNTVSRWSRTGQLRLAGKRAVPGDRIEAGQAISYAEVLGLLGHHFTRPKMRALCKVLAYVDEEAEARGEPELAVLVVRQSDGLPGQGWWIGGAKKHGYTGLWEGPKAARLIRKIQGQTFNYWAGREA